jgi:hypothetical protein
MCSSSNGTNFKSNFKLAETLNHQPVGSSIYSTLSTFMSSCAETCDNPEILDDLQQWTISASQYDQAKDFIEKMFDQIGQSEMVELVDYMCSVFWKSATSTSKDAIKNRRFVQTFTILVGAEGTVKTTKLDKMDLDYMN